MIFFSLSNHWLCINLCCRSLKGWLWTCYLIQGRNDFQPHESSLCSGGENWKVLESRRMAIHFAFLPFFFFLGSWHYRRNRRDRESPDVTPPQKSDMLLRLYSWILCRTPISSQLRKTICSYFLACLSETIFHMNLFYLWKYYELTWSSIPPTPLPPPKYRKCD